MPRTGDMMSANITAASTPCRRTGWSVTSAHSSGVPATSKKPCRSRIARYSGSERPAWRMNHTGVRSTGSRRAARRTRGADDGLFLAFHWLDDRGNAIVWDGTRTPLEREVAPGDTLRQKLVLRGPIPPGRYRLAVDLVEEHRFWLSELGNAPYEEDVDVLPREAGAARVFLGDGAQPADDWREKVRALHEEGYAAVGGAIEQERGLL